MKNIDLNNSAKLEALRESLNKVIDKKINEHKLSEKIDSLKGLSFGEYKVLFESVLEELYDLPEGKKLIGSYVKLIKENKAINTVFGILEGIGTLDKEKSEMHAYCVSKLCEDVDRKALLEGEKKMHELTVKAIKEAKTVTCESIDAALNENKKLNDSIAYLTHSKVNTFGKMNEHVNCVNALRECILESEKKDKNSVEDNKTSGELCNELSNVISEGNHTAWENKVIKDLALCNISTGNKEDLFETYKNACINAIDEVTDGDSSNNIRLYTMKQQLSEKKYNAETLVDDLFILAEMKEKLLEA